MNWTSRILKRLLKLFKGWPEIFLIFTFSSNLWNTSWKPFPNRTPNRKRVYFLPFWMLFCWFSLKNWKKSYKEISDEELAADYTFISQKEVEYEISNNKKTFHVGKWARVNNWGGSGRVRIQINWIRKINGMIGTFNHFVRQTFVRYYEPCGEPHTAGPGQMV